MKPDETKNRIIRRLGHSSQGIIRALGWEDALAFLLVWGGREVYVPKYYNPAHRLFVDLTEEQANNLSSIFGGKEIKMPSYRTMLASERYQLIAFDFVHRKFSQKMLQDKYNLTRQTVDWIIQSNELNE